MKPLKAPQIPKTEPVTYNLPDAEFIEELQLLNGMPREVLEFPDLVREYSDLLVQARTPLDCPITVSRILGSCPRLNAFAWFAGWKQLQQTA